MDKLGFEDVLRTVCESLPKAKRFSNLSQIELSDIWKESTLYVYNQLSNRKSINFPGLGAFYIRRMKRAAKEDVDIFVPCFVPSSNWDKLPGFHVKKSPLVGAQAAETLNYSAVASHSGFARDDIEAALKDIMLALFRILKRDSNVVLPFSNLGRLYFQNREIKLRFYPEFLETIADSMGRSDASLPPVKDVKDASLPAPPPLEPKQDLQPQIPTVSPVSISNNQTLAVPKLTEPILTTITTSTTTPTALIAVNGTSDDSPSSKAATVATSSYAEGTVGSGKSGEDDGSGDGDDIGKGDSDVPLIDEAIYQNDLANKYSKYLDRGGHHTHPHSGDRLWSNIKCPICRQSSASYVDLKEQLARREKEQDKMLLHLSLEVDRDYLRRTKELESSKLKVAVNTAQYNCGKASEQETKRKMEAKNLPMGNLFENREPPPDRRLQAQELAAGLNDQITINQMRRLREKNVKQAEDQALNERMIKEFKMMEIFNHLEKLKRRQEQQEALSEQIKKQSQRNKDGPGEPMKENHFARSESLMLLYQKEKAKQLYQEQLAIMKQKQEYEARVAALERQHSLERLALSRKELEKDLRSIKRAQFETRKSLETVWAKQKLEREQQSQIYV
ncbi:Coiled-coil domain-containing protein 81 [Blyttiomyces sp. JEL0837]|nr:Coiled-coil domain-containing protein 81 [Blyttiomyces sp. JEL0837]